MDNFPNSINKHTNTSILATVLEFLKKESAEMKFQHYAGIARGYSYARVEVLGFIRFVPRKYGCNLAKTNASVASKRID